MRRLLRIVLWAALGMVALLLTAIAAVLIFSRTARFNDLLRVQIVNYLAQTYRGRITIGKIEGSIWGSLSLYDIEVHHRDAAIASIAQLKVGYQILPALQNRIVVSEIAVFEPNLQLAHDPDGQWNLLAAIAKRHPSPRSSTTLNIALQRFSIERADVSIAPAPSVIYRLTKGSIEGSGHMGISGQTFKVDKISFSLTGPKIPPTRAQGATQYDEAGQVATISIPSFAIRTDRSRIDFNGTLRDLSEKNIDATINLHKLAADDVNAIASQAKLARDVSGKIQVRGNAADMRTTMLLNAGEARVRALVEADITKSEPVWKLDSQLAEVDLRNLLKRNREQLPAGRIDARMRASGLGSSQAAAKAELHAHVAGLAARGLSLGDLTITAAVDHQTSNLRALLAGPGGRAQLIGRIEIAKIPAYNITLALNHLRPKSIVQAGSIPPADLNLSAAIDGSGYHPDSMHLRAAVRMAPSSVRTVHIDNGRLEAQLSSGIVRIAALSLKAGDTSVNVKGQLALDKNRGGSLTYKLAVGQLAQWLAMAGRHGSGTINLAGQAYGSLKSLHTNGSAEFSKLHLDTYSVNSAHFIYDLSGLGTPLKPAGQLMLTANGLHTAVELKSIQTNVRLIPGAALGAAIALNAQDRFSHPATIRTDISYSPALTTVNLTEIVLATDHGSWRLSAPAQIIRRGSALEIHHLVVANQKQSLAVDGTLAQSGQQNMTVRVEHVSLGDLAGFLPQQVKITGLLSTELSVRGSAAAPIVAMSANIRPLTLAGLPQAGMSAHLSCANGRAQADLTLAQDASHSLTANAALPLALSWAQRFQAKPTGDVDVRARSNGLDLAVLNAFGRREVSGIGGVLSLDIAAHGPLQHPVPSGFLRLSGAHASVTQLKVEVTEGSSEIQFEPGRVRLASLSAKAGEGTLTGGGTVGLQPNGLPRQVDLHVALDRWPAIATHEYNATMAARINASGHMTAMHVDGRVEVLKALLRPDLSVTGSAPRPDESITVVHQWGEHPRHPPSPPASTTGPSSTYRNLALEMDVVIDRNTWIKTTDFAVELQGNLHVHKVSGSAAQPNISGTIHTVRGRLAVAGREFDLARGEIMFTGGHKVDPELLIVAQRKVQKYTVSATVSGTASKPALALSSIPELPQADVLSVMMFGKPSNELSGGQQKDLQNQALSMAGSYAASQAGQAIAEALGLGELGVTSSSAGVGFGRYVSQNVYVSASQSTSNMSNRQAEIQYYLTPSVNLGTTASTNYGNEVKLQWHKEY